MFNDLPRQFYSTFIENDRWRMFLDGFGMTMLIAVGAVILGLILGAVIAIIKVNAGMNRKSKLLRILNVICDIYLTVIRGTPMMVQLLIAYSVIFAAFPNDMSFVVAILAFGINSGAYVAEIIRSGIQAVPRGQMEAGRSLGLSNGTTMKSIILPQAIKNILPALGNELIVLLKETAIVGTIAVTDVTQTASLIQSRTYMPLVPLLAAAAIYLIVVMLMTWGLKKLERRLARSDYR